MRGAIGERALLASDTPRARRALMCAIVRASADHPARPARRRYASILDAARDRVVRVGHERAINCDVAAVAGVTAAAIYQCFDSMLDIIPKPPPEAPVPGADACGPPPPCSSTGSR